MTTLDRTRRKMKSDLLTAIKNNYNIQIWKCTILSWTVISATPFSSVRYLAALLSPNSKPGTELVTFEEMQNKNIRFKNIFIDRLNFFVALLLLYQFCGFSPHNVSKFIWVQLKQDKVFYDPTIKWSKLRELKELKKTYLQENLDRPSLDWMNRHLH